MNFFLLVEGCLQGDESGTPKVGLSVFDWRPLLTTAPVARVSLVP
ncbi:hypothetical protein [Arthrobacter sp. NamB2]|nr:hypothetical protein [Arthrobacter sp. NamB2]